MNNSHYLSMVAYPMPQQTNRSFRSEQETKSLEVRRGIQRKSFRYGYKSAINEMLDTFEQKGIEEALKELHYRKIYEDSIDIILDEVYEDTTDNIPGDEELREVEIELKGGCFIRASFLCSGEVWRTTATYDSPADGGFTIDYKLTCIKLYDEEGEIAITDDNPCVEGEWRE